MGLQDHFVADRSSTSVQNQGREPLGYKAMEELKQRVCYVLSYNKNIGVVQTKIQVLTEMVAQVQSLRISGGRDDVRKWLVEAGEILARANTFLEGSTIMAVKKRLCSTCWDPTSSWEIGDILRVIDRIFKDQEGLNLPSMTYCKNLQSRENMLEDILEALMDIRVNMVGIYGMFGVGKTVLAKEIARRAQYNQLFDAIVMVQMCEYLDVKLIQTQIANKIGLQLSESEDEDTRAHILCNKLDEKAMEIGQENNIKPIQQSKILVILDGIHNVIDLRKVGISHEQEGKSRCKVVVISRNSDVCKEMGPEKNYLLECLTLEEAKILFRERLGDKIKSMYVTLESERYQYVENVMLLKCRGLPRMVNALACALRSISWSNWEILADEREMHTLLEFDIVKEVPSAILELCNNFIQSGKNRKHFLLCCLLIQQGEDGPLVKLMRYGTGFGLFEVGSLYSIHDQLYSWVHELKSLSLLMDGKIPQNVKMHDLVQDVVISALSQGIYSLPVMLEAGTGWHTRESYENCVAMSMTPSSNFNCLNGLELPKLEIFLLKGGERSSILPNNFFQGMLNLKILDISEMGHISSSIRELKNLVTLHLEHCDISGGVIFMICNLDRLEVLSLRGSTLGTLPDEIGNLANLRVLDLTRCKFDTFPVDAVVKLDRLRELYLSSDWNPSKWSTVDMKKLASLSLEEFEITIEHAEQVSPAGSLKFPNSERFRISYIDYDGETQSDENFTSYSRAISINNKNGRLQLSVMKDLVPRAEYLHIVGAIDLEQGIADLNINGGFSHLKELFVNNCSTMKCLLDANMPIIQQRVMFPELQVLTLCKLHNLTSICCPQPCHGFFPRLVELRLDFLTGLRHVLPLQVAVRLKVMKVSNCWSLLHIYSNSKIDEIQHGADELSVELPFMEKLELKVLPEMASLLALQDLPESSTTREEFQVTRYLLFNEKIKLPSLKELHLAGLDQIWNVWDLLGSEEACRKSPCFGNLKEITISDCDKLENVFPSWIVNSLFHLEKLEVEICRNMKEVITSTDYTEPEDTNPTTTINFPKLHTLKLQQLSSLQCFSRGRLPLKFPKLKKLHLSDLEKMKAFTLSNTQSLQTQGMATTLFDGVIDFGSLDNLSISHMEIESLQRDGETILFPNMSELTLAWLPNMQALPNINSTMLRTLNLGQVEFSIQSVACKSAMPIVMSWELEELQLTGVDSFWKDLFVDYENRTDDGQQLDFKLLSSLWKLELSSMFCQRIPWNWLKNLRSLIIVHVKVGGNSLISTTLVVGGGVLPLLEDIKIQESGELEAIISGEAEEDWEFVKYGITLFPCLRRIQLFGLCKLKSFSMGKYEMHFPSLETIQINRCDSMQSFSLGRIRTPRLKLVKLGSTYSDGRIADINELFQSGIYDHIKQINVAACIAREAELPTLMNYSGQLQQPNVPRISSRAAEEPKQHKFDNPSKTRTNPIESQMKRNLGPAQASKPNPPPLAKPREGGEFKKVDDAVPRPDNASLRPTDSHQRHGGRGMNFADSQGKPHGVRSAGVSVEHSPGGRGSSSQPSSSSSDSWSGVSGRLRTRQPGRPSLNLPVGGPIVPEFGAWNKNPEQAEGYTDVFIQVLTDKKLPGRNASSSTHNPLGTPKKVEGISRFIRSFSDLFHKSTDGI